jgi:Rrf2 family transcriptional repressor of oqxAB
VASFGTPHALVASVKGRSGGVRLGRSADQITLGEIYRSSIGDKPLWAPRPEGPRECLVTNHSAEYFVRLTDETEAAVLDALAGRTLADSLDELRAIDRACSAPASERPFPAPRH